MAIAMNSLGYDEYMGHIELADTDAFGVIFWGSAVRWSQRGYENLARSAGHPIETMLNSAQDHPVVSAKIEYCCPLRLGDRIRVRTDIPKVGNRSFHVRIRVFGPDDQLAVKAKIVHVASSRTGGPVVLDEWVKALNHAAAAECD
jgi:YbgC/YbaW family acyl-CoA thioester hydrolase